MTWEARERLMAEVREFADQQEPSVAAINQQHAAAGTASARGSNWPLTPQAAATSPAALPAAAAAAAAGAPAAAAGLSTGSSPLVPAPAAGSSFGGVSVEFLVRSLSAATLREESLKPFKRDTERYFWLALGACEVELTQQLYRQLAVLYGVTLGELRCEIGSRTVAHMLVTRNAYW